MRYPVPIIQGLTRSGASSNTYSNAGTYYGVVETLTGVLYSFYIDAVGSDPYYSKSTNNGRTWGTAVQLKSCSAYSIAVWYDRWSGINGDLIHIVYTDSTSDDTFYRNLNTSDDTLSSETTVFAGVSTAAGGALSITRARGGNLIVATCIDAGAEYDTVKSTDVGVNWASIAEVWEGATQDQVILMPGFAADNQDIIAIFWDASADEISRKLYDDSGDSWAETSISGSMVDDVSLNYYPHFSAAPDLTNSLIVLTAWNGIDTSGQDLLCWAVTESSITAKTNIITNATDDMFLSGLQIISGAYYAFFCGKSDGSQIVPNTVSISYSISTDGGVSWGAITELSPDVYYRLSVTGPPISYKNINVVFYDISNQLLYYAKHISPKSTYAIGL